MNAKLTWHAEEQGLRFRVSDGAGRAIPESAWGATQVRHAAGPASIAPLLTLLDDAGLTVDPDGSLLVPHALVAAWDKHQIAQLGLPPVAPFHLNIRGQGVLSSPAFRFRHQLQSRGGVPVMGANRQGVILRVGAALYSLPDPLFSLIEGMERYNATPESDMDARFAAWGELQALLPEDAVVDQQLRSMNIARADALTLDVGGGDDFDPVLLEQPELDQAARERGETSVPRDLLPPAAQRNFGQRFRAFPDARRRYALSGNWFVMVPEPLRAVLNVVRQMQDAPPERRRAFIANPYAGIKEQLADQIDPERIEGLFQETPAFLSERVEKLGEWHPKLQAFVPQGMMDWFPADERTEPSGGDDGSRGGGAGGDGEEPTVGVPTSAGVVNVKPWEVPDLVKGIRKARQGGEAIFDWNGQLVPADEETEQAFERIQQAKPEPARPVVPIIKDNLDEVGFKSARRLRPGTPGGLPRVLKSNLFQHQHTGLDWLQQHWVAGTSGALLADDMGLGKTIQTLAFLSWVDEQTADNDTHKPHLIVAPTGLLKNWEAEAEQHLAEPGLGDLFRAYGADLRQLREMSGHERRRYLRDRAHWVLTTYETLRDKISLFVDVPWRVVVFDEAQRIKNPGARVTDMAKSLDAELTLAVTGTPVENSLTDLWCIVDAVQPGLLGAHSDFKSTYAVQADADPNVLQPLQSKLERDTRPPALLRRMKQDHLEGLPEKYVHRAEREMPADQVTAYDAIVAAARTSAGQAGAVLGALQGLRRVSLLPDDTEDDGLTDATVQRSARLQALIDVLDEVAEKSEKALVFLEFLKVQEMLVPYLRQRYRLPRDPLRIHGGTLGAVRKKHVDEFQNGKKGEFDVMILSPKAAGVGLTLTAANHVVHLSRWWNPAVEDQCTDRVYRIGQQSEVHVHLPLAIHPRFREQSFDLNLDRLLERKRSLCTSLFAPPAASEEDLSRLAEESLGSRSA
ncbi:DNA/RNA helicase, superfamily II, SNF2 family [Thioflavicoccus mobilis 8321]|uniref:DNA/RNA helicase, superfamily II, SNF2 family n=1 Tax=Thioflavicoccus mobilis 8321 TaxID=765912 RepID=L0GYV0_9GAMM|nr:DEAD/DEAH box helicase [Thioflavicoccus mobilis]AGA90550.1 DNA/RNA helicase, superfamily II, SNF2 family [Thioflavicoccus mobilis 8321]